MNAVTLRKTLRWFHIAGGLILGTYLYSPWSSNPVFEAITIYLVTPALALTGLVMWKQMVVTKWFRRKNA